LLPDSSNGWTPSKDKRAKQRNAVLPDDVTMHDIRRTVADALLNRIGAPGWIVDHVVLGHARPKLLRTYMPMLPLGEVREALERWPMKRDSWAWSHRWKPSRSAGSSHNHAICTTPAVASAAYPSSTAASPTLKECTAGSVRWEVTATSA
jgi:hypothetical protein